MLDQLPSGSAYWAARASDEEVAAYVLSQEEIEPRPSLKAPPLTEMAYSTQLLMTIADRLGGVIACLEALGGVKPGVVKALPRPLTAIEKLRDRLEAAGLEELEAEVRAAMERSERTQRKGI